MQEPGRAGRVLDVTRLMRRVGRPVLTGIDRVERAYLRAFLADTDVPCRFLVARGGLQWLLPPEAGAALLAWLDAAPGPRPARQPAGLLDRAARRFGGTGALVGRRLTAMAIGAAPTGPALTALLGRALPAGGWFFSTGHLNAEPRLWQALRAGGLQVAVMVHDTIPLDHPEFSEAHAPGEMAALLAAVEAAADLVLCNSAATAADLRRHGVTTEALVAHLGLDPAVPPALPAGLPPQGAYFVAIGTLEPRKNHVMLLDLWERMATETPVAALPRLLLIGRRGWRNAALLARLDASPLTRAGVITLHETLDDGAVAALLQGARALLMPSLAEGYGLPPLEAARAGVPVLATPLPVYREILGDYPVYLDPGDLYAWQRWVACLADGRTVDAGPGEREAIGTVPAGELPGWPAHFKRVLTRAE